MLLKDGKVQAYLVSFDVCAVHLIHELPCASSVGEGYKREKLANRPRRPDVGVRIVVDSEGVARVRRHGLLAASNGGVIWRRGDPTRVDLSDRFLITCGGRIEFRCMGLLETLLTTKIYIISRANIRPTLRASYRWRQPRIVGDYIPDLPVSPLSCGAVAVMIGL